MDAHDDPIAACLERWHAVVDGARVGRLDPDLLDDLLAADVTFVSPVMFTPQHGKAATTMYLRGAMHLLAGADSGFRYVREIAAGHDAMLEFETAVDATQVNGVDIIHCDDDARITEFKVMLRPRRAIDAVHAAMGALLASLGDQRPPA